METAQCVSTVCVKHRTFVFDKRRISQGETKRMRHIQDPWIRPQAKMCLHALWKLGKLHQKSLGFLLSFLPKIMTWKFYKIYLSGTFGLDTYRQSPWGTVHVGEGSSHKESLSKWLKTVQLLASTVTSSFHNCPQLCNPSDGKVWQCAVVNHRYDCARPKVSGCFRVNMSWNVQWADYPQFNNVHNKVAPFSYHDIKSPHTILLQIPSQAMCEPHLMYRLLLPL